uniref:Calponin-homology (CH) domain-containing protein n=1 Tax=Sinocyclocheilus grahami TaxID=75366 RepID=A0A672QG38_SINGR
MEWRPQSAVGYEAAYSEAQRWIEAVTKKKFGSSNFRSSLENGLLLCDLINKIRPGVVKKLNRLSTPIAGLVLNVFSVRILYRAAWSRPVLLPSSSFTRAHSDPKHAHCFYCPFPRLPQESSRRLKNVLITIFWLGRKAHAYPFYNGPYLKLKAFEGLLGTYLTVVFTFRC